VEDEGSATAVQAQVVALLERPLTAEGAVQIALLKNRGLQVAFNELGVSEALYVRAGQPPAPKISLMRLAGSLELEIERQIIVGLLELATMPARTAVAAERFRAAQFRSAEAVLRLATETRRQYFRAVAANQQVFSRKRLAPRKQLPSSPNSSARPALSTSCSKPESMPFTWNSVRSSRAPGSSSGPCENGLCVTLGYGGPISHQSSRARCPCCPSAS
jgi:hypothetical protein